MASLLEKLKRKRFLYRILYRKLKEEEKAKLGNTIMLRVDDEFGVLSKEFITSLFRIIATRPDIIGINFSEAGFSKEAALQVAEELRKNPALQCISFKNSYFEEKNFDKIIESLRENNTLEVLRVDSENFKEESRETLTQILREQNTTLSRVVIAGETLPPEMQERLDFNRFLKRVKVLRVSLQKPKKIKLDVHTLHLGYKDMKMIAEAIPKNTSIGALRFSFGPLTKEEKEDIKERFKGKGVVVVEKKRKRRNNIFDTRPATTRNIGKEDVVDISTITEDEAKALNTALEKRENFTLTHTYAINSPKISEATRNRLKANFAYNGLLNAITENKLSKLSSPYTLGFIGDKVVIDLSEARLTYDDLERLVTAISEDTNITCVKLNLDNLSILQQRSIIAILKEKKVDILEKRYKVRKSGRNSKRLRILYKSHNKENFERLTYKEGTGRNGKKSLRVDKRSVTHSLVTALFRQFCMDSSTVLLGFSSVMFEGTAAEQIGEELAENTTLKGLFIGGINPGDKKLAKRKVIHRSAIRKNPFGDDDFKPIISALEHNKTLEVLHVSGSHITNESVKALETILKERKNLHLIKVNIKTSKDVNLSASSRLEELLVFNRALKCLRENKLNDLPESYASVYTYERGTLKLHESLTYKDCEILIDAITPKHTSITKVVFPLQNLEQEQKEALEEKLKLKIQLSRLSRSPVPSAQQKNKKPRVNSEPMLRTERRSKKDRTPSVATV